jgi:PIN domain nuclease of toxin-antitoxin system
VVLDANCLIAHFLGEPGADDVAPLLRNGQCVMSTLNRAEVIDRLGRSGSPSADVIAAIEILEIDFADVDTAIADRAAALRSKHYHRTNRPVSLADCVALATAKGDGLQLATSDQDLAAMADDEGVAVVAVANSRGVRPHLARPSTVLRQADPGLTLELRELAPDTTDDLPW